MTLLALLAIGDRFLVRGSFAKYTSRETNVKVGKVMMDARSPELPEFALIANDPFRLQSRFRNYRRSQTLPFWVIINPQQPREEPLHKQRFS